VGERSLLAILKALTHKHSPNFPISPNGYLIFRNLYQGPTPFANAFAHPEALSDPVHFY
jgi:hypothetical protein